MGRGKAITETPAWELLMEALIVTLFCSPVMYWLGLTSIEQFKQNGIDGSFILVTALAVIPLSVLGWVYWQTLKELRRRTVNQNPNQ